MLKLRRKQAETIVLRHPGLPGDIVIQHSGRAIYQLITAPESVEIIRGEVLARTPGPKPPREAA